MWFPKVGEIPEIVHVEERVATEHDVSHAIVMSVKSASVANAHRAFVGGFFMEAATDPLFGSSVVHMNAKEHGFHVFLGSAVSASEDELLKLRMCVMEMNNEMFAFAQTVPAQEAAFRFRGLQLTTGRESECRRVFVKFVGDSAKSVIEMIFRKCASKHAPGLVTAVRTSYTGEEITMLDPFYVAQVINTAHKGAGNERRTHRPLTGPVSQGMTSFDASELMHGVHSSACFGGASLGDVRFELVVGDTSAVEFWRCPKCLDPECIS